MKVVVLGGGLSGLFTASELVASGYEDVLVVDRDILPGGVAQTVHRDGFSLEPAVGSFLLPHPHLSPILRRANVELTRTAVASQRYVFKSGRLVEVKVSPKAVLTPLLTASGKLRALAEPLVRSGSHDVDETLASFCNRRFGKEAGELLGWLMASGVYAGSPDELSASSAFPTVVSLMEQAGSVVRGGLRARRRRDDTPRPRAHIPVGGTTAIASAIVASLGDRYRPEFEVVAVRPQSSGWVVEGTEDLAADVVILTTHPLHSAQLVDSDLAFHLERSVSAPVVTVGLGGRGESPLPPGFGALVTPDNSMASRGLLFESSYAPGRAPDNSWLLKVILGGAPSPEVVHWDDDRLLAVAISEAGRVVGSDLDPQFTEVVSHQPGIPQYVVGHESWLAELDRLLALRPGLHVTGWGYRGVGIAHQATDAVRLVSRIGTV